MFGQDDHSQNNTPSNDTTTPAEPTDDGTLGVPAPDMMPEPSRAEPVVMSGGAEPNEPVSAPASSVPADDTSSPASDDEDLIDLKQAALQQLKPLVGHLDQTPEEKFRTTMMMIQAADDQSLVGDAYEAAKAIDDEKARAQALLDVVNEINYFTSQKD